MWHCESVKALNIATISTDIITSHKHSLLNVNSHTELQTHAGSASDKAATLTFSPQGQCMLTACHASYSYQD